MIDIGYCASAANGHSATLRPRSMMNSRRLMLSMGYLNSVLRGGPVSPVLPKNSTTRGTNMRNFGSLSHPFFWAYVICHQLRTSRTGAVAPPRAPSDFKNQHGLRARLQKIKLLSEGRDGS
jgi:hypothetical protein